MKRRIITHKGLDEIYCKTFSMPNRIWNIMIKDEMYETYI